MRTSFRVEVLETGHVYRNARPNVWARHAWFPSVVKLSESELLASFDLGSAMENVDVRTHLSRSMDGGRTWGAPVLLTPPPATPYPASLLGRLSRMGSGELVGLLLVCDRSRTEEGLAHPVTEGYVETRFALTTSEDNGHTWSPPRLLDLPQEWSAYEICSPVLDAGGQRRVLPASLWRAWDGSCPQGMKAVAFVSEDSGATWGRCVEVMDLWADQVTAWEQKYTQLADGRWLVTCWAYDYGAGKSLPNRYSFSGDNFDSFGPALESPLAGETCTPLALEENVVLFVYRRVDKRGLWAHVARMEGERWTPLSDTPLWGTGEASYGAASENKVVEMSTLRFGYPQCVRLSKEEVLVVFWCVEECVAGIRYLRLGVR